jgi:hypothetical protein
MWIFGKHQHLKPETLSEYLDGRLPGRDQVKVERAVAECALCQGELEELRATVSLLRTLPEFAPSRSFTLSAPPVTAPLTAIDRPSLFPSRVPAWAYAGAAALAGLAILLYALTDAGGLPSLTWPGGSGGSPEMAMVQEAAAPAAPAPPAAPKIEPQAQPASAVMETMPLPAGAPAEAATVVEAMAAEAAPPAQPAIPATAQPQPAGAPVQAIEQEIAKEVTIEKEVFRSPTPLPNAAGAPPPPPTQAAGPPARNAVPEESVPQEASAQRGSAPDATPVPAPAAIASGGGMSIPPPPTRPAEAPTMTAVPASSVQQISPATGSPASTTVPTPDPSPVIAMAAEPAAESVVSPGPASAATTHRTPEPQNADVAAAVTGASTEQTVVPGETIEADRFTRTDGRYEGSATPPLPSRSAPADPAVEQATPDLRQEAASPSELPPSPTSGEEAEGTGGPSSNLPGPMGPEGQAGPRGPPGPATSRKLDQPTGDGNGLPSVLGGLTVALLTALILVFTLNRIRNRRMKEV